MPFEEESARIKAAHYATIHFKKNVSLRYDSFVDTRDCYHVSITMLTPFNANPIDYYQLCKSSMCSVWETMSEAQDNYSKLNAPLVPYARPTTVEAGQDTRMAADKPGEVMRT